MCGRPQARHWLLLPIAGCKLRSRHVRSQNAGYKDRRVIASLYFGWMKGVGPEQGSSRSPDPSP